MEKASLFSSNPEIKKVIKKYTAVLECSRCNKIYTEISNVGCWQCKYHPGVLDHDKKEWTCCGEKAHLVSNYNSFARYGIWKDKFSPVPMYSIGCTPCDHLSYDSPLPYKDVNVENIAQLIPFMHPELTERNYSLKDRKPFLLRKKPFIP